MHFLSPDEVVYWQNAVEKLLNGRCDLKSALSGVRKSMEPVFYFHYGALLAAHGRENEAAKCFADGALWENDKFFSNAFIAAFMERHNHKLEAPALCFSDPAPYVHFTTTPQFKAAREIFCGICDHALYDYKKPFSIIDLGTGNGALLVQLLDCLKKSGRIAEIEKVLLVDSSPAMLELAVNTVSASVPREKIKTLQCRIQEAVSQIDSHYDVALASLSYHHMPLADKIKYLKILKPKIDNFMLFEMDADNDRHELHSPELSLAVYQSYGRMIDFIFEHDAPLSVAQMCVDNFLMTEEISFLKEPHGKRSDYHMLRTQWRELFEAVLAPEFVCKCHSDCVADEYLSLFAMIYGR